MPATLTVPDDIVLRARRSAEREGVSVETKLLRILEISFPDIPEELAEEFEQWEAASDEDFDRFLKRESPTDAAR